MRLHRSITVVMLWIWPGYSLMRCHLHTQLSSGLITAIRPSKLLLVQSYTLSLLFFMRRNSSQLSQPSVSNWSKDCVNEMTNIERVLANWMKYILCSRIMSAFTLTKEQTRHARNPRKSFGTVSKDIFAVSSSKHLFPIGRHKSSNNRACLDAVFCWSKWTQMRSYTTYNKHPFDTSFTSFSFWMSAFNGIFSSSTLKFQNVGRKTYLP